MVRQGSAKPPFPSSNLGAAFRPWASDRCVGDGRLKAGVAELADARDLKSRELKGSYRFESGLRHERPLTSAGCAITMRREAAVQRNG